MRNEKPPQSSFTYGPLSEKDARVNRQIVSIGENVKLSKQSEANWKMSHHLKEGLEEDESGYSNDAIASVFEYISRINAAKQYNDIHRLALTLENPNDILPTQSNMSKSEALTNHWLATSHTSVTLSELYSRGKAMAYNQPVALYGHMLLSTFEPAETEKIEETINFLPITLCDENEVRLIIKQGQFPTHINDTYKELSKNFLQAKRRVRTLFLEPKSQHFPAIEDLYTAVTSNGTPLQKDLFYAQLLGINASEQGRYAYGKLSDLVQEDDYPAIYDECLAVIEDSFDGLLGEDVYELLGLDHSPHTIANDEHYIESHYKKQQLLKLIKSAHETINLPDGEYGELYLIDPSVYCHKNGTETYVQLFASAKTASEGTVPFDFQLNRKQAYSWSFLRNYPEVPELFNAVTQTTNAALDCAITLVSPTPSTGSATAQSAAPAKKNHYRDPVHDLRKQHIDEQRQAAKNDQEVLQTTGEKNDTNYYTITLPENIANKLSTERHADTVVAIDKFNKGLTTAKPLRYLSQAMGNDIWSIRGNRRVRVLLRREGDTFTVINGGMRGDIYRVRK